MTTDDSPEREFDVYDSEGLPAAEGEALPNHSNPMENPKPSRKPRREVWWRDLGVTNHSLKSIGRCFEDRLNWSLLSSSNFLLRHIRSPKDDNLRRNFHQCPGYFCEEITLTCDLSKSVIVSHVSPDLGERCSICHQLVQYMTPFNYNNFISDCPSPTTSDSLSPPPEAALSFDQFAPAGGIDPFARKMVTSSDASDASSLIGEMFLPSLPFDEDIIHYYLNWRLPDNIGFKLFKFSWMPQCQQTQTCWISKFRSESKLSYSR